MKKNILKVCVLLLVINSYANYSFKEKTKPINKTIDLYWDTSFSMQNKNINKELELLNLYFNELQNVTVNLIVFSNVVISQKTYNINTGNWLNLKTKLEEVVYDGATNFNKLTAAIINSKSDQSLFFSDMINSLSEDIVTFNNKLCIINSNSSNNEINDGLIKKLTENQKGVYINLNEISIAKSLDFIINLSGKSQSKIIKNVENRKIITSQKIERIKKPIKARKTIDNISGEFVTSGIVFDEFGPVSGIAITNHNTQKGIVTDFDGYYELNVKIGNTLIFSHVSYEKQEIKVEGKILDLKMKSLLHELDEVEIVGVKKKKIDYIARKKLSRGYGVTRLDSKDIKYKTNLAQVLIGKIPGLTMRANDLNSIRLRETRGLSTASSPPLFILDDSPISIDMAESINIETIANIRVIKGLRGTNRYGNHARGGVIFITTFSYIDKKKLAKKYIAPYFKAYKNLKTSKQYYETYLKQRDKFKDYPAYFIDVYATFLEKGFGNLYANRILSNIAEYYPNNPEMLKAYAYHLEQINNDKLAIQIYSKLFYLLPDDIQSYRDLANAFINNKSYKNAALLQDYILSNQIKTNLNPTDLKSINLSVFNELNQLLFLDDKLYLKEKYKKHLFNSELDIRVVVDWNHDDTDIDLYVIEPNKEKCFIGNPITKNGGELLADMTSYGPEIYTFKNAMNGKYQLKLNYNRDYTTNIENPTFVKVSVFKNYGKTNQTKKIQTFRLSGKSGEFELFDFNFN